MERISHAFRDMGLPAVTAHGTRAHGTPRERKQHSFKMTRTLQLNGEVPNSTSWCLRLSYAILFHPKLGFNEGELGERMVID